MRRMKYLISTVALLSVLGFVICESSGDQPRSWVRTVSAAEIREEVLIPEEKYWKYEENEDGGIWITGFDDYDDYEDEGNQSYQLVIPQTLGGKKVTDVGGSGWDDYFLRTSRKITSLKVPEGVTHIYRLDGHSSPHVSIELPTTLKVIGSGAFRDWQNLQTIKIPEGVTSIGDSAFYECHNLQSIELPDSLTEIEMYAFYKCISLKKLRIPAKVTDIGASAFQDCGGMEAFEVDPANSRYVSENGVLIENQTGPGYDPDSEINKSIISYPAAKKGEFYIEKNMRGTWNLFSMQKD